MTTRQEATDATIREDGEESLGWSLSFPHANREEHCALCGERLDLTLYAWRDELVAPDNEQEPIRVTAHSVCLEMASTSPSAPNTLEGYLEVLTGLWDGRRWPPGTRFTALELPLLEALRRQRWTALEAMCCERAAHGSAERCSCWVPVYDRRQAPPRPGPLDVQPDRCADCACRPDSLEAQTYRDGVDRGLASSLDGVMDLARRGVPFFCHEGMRRIRGWRHPISGRWLPLKREDDYAAPMVGGVAYRADGRPALVCAGWMSFRRAHLEAEHATDQQHFFSGPLGLPYTPGGSDD